MSEIMPILLVVFYAYVFIAAIICIGILIQSARYMKYNTFNQLFVGVVTTIILCSVWPYFWKNAHDGFNSNNINKD